MNSRELEKNDRLILHCENENSILVSYLLHLL
jgi:hypothetical protein